MPAEWSAEPLCLLGTRAVLFEFVSMAPCGTGVACEGHTRRS
jgi:hypothetical protein